MPKIFISYRRSDSSGEAGRIYDRLAKKIGSENVFKDTSSKPSPGDDFREKIKQAVSVCDVMLVLIGNTWTTVEKDGRRRLSDPDDWVRIEIESGLTGGARVIPILLDTAEMPTTSDLPDSLKKLVHKNAHPIRNDPDFDNDINTLIDSIGGKKRPFLLFAIAGISLIAIAIFFSWQNLILNPQRTATAQAATDTMSTANAQGTSTAQAENDIQATNDANAQGTAVHSTVTARETANALGTCDAAPSDWNTVEGERGSFQVPNEGNWIEIDSEDGTIDGEDETLDGFISLIFDSNEEIQDFYDVFGSTAVIDRATYTLNGGEFIVLAIYNDNNVTRRPENLIIGAVRDRFEKTVLEQRILEETVSIPVGEAATRFQGEVMSDDGVIYQIITYLVIRENGRLSDSLNFAVSERLYDNMTICQIANSWQLNED